MIHMVTLQPTLSASTNMISAEEEIFHKWLNGTGRTPKSWATLVTVLREIGMAALAHDIEQNMAQ